MLAEGADGMFGHFFFCLSYLSSRRLKYCLKGPLNPKPTSYKLYSLPVMNAYLLGHPRVLGSWGERPFIFRKLRSKLLILESGGVPSECDLDFLTCVCLRGEGDFAARHPRPHPHPHPLYMAILPFNSFSKNDFRWPFRLSTASISGSFLARDLNYFNRRSNKKIGSMLDYLRELRLLLFYCFTSTVNI